MLLCCAERHARPGHTRAKNQPIANTALQLLDCFACFFFFKYIFCSFIYLPPLPSSGKQWLGWRAPPISRLFILFFIYILRLFIHLIPLKAARVLSCTEVENKRGQQDVPKKRKRTKNCGGGIHLRRWKWWIYTGMEKSMGNVWWFGKRERERERKKHALSWAGGPIVQWLIDRFIDCLFSFIVLIFNSGHGSSCQDSPFILTSIIIILL